MDHQGGGMAMIDAALEYAALGWPVLPLHTPVAGGCSCLKPDCSSPGKHPRTMHGLKDATTDPEKIREWFTTWSNANIGVTTGAQSKIIVIDADGPEGLESLNKLQGRYGKISERCFQRTGNGYQLFFQHPGFPVRNIQNDPNKMGRGIDVRGDGGYVVAPPSGHYSGRQYEWQTDYSNIPPAPEWLITLLRSPSPQPPTNGDGSAIPKGQRDNTLLSLAGTMRRRGLSSEEIAAALRVVNEKRCDPPLPDADVARIAESVARYKPAEPHHDVDTKKKSQAAVLVEIASEAELFHSESGDAYASFKQGEHLETSPLRAKAFRQYLSYKFYQNEQKVPSTQAIQDAVNTLSGQAAFDGPCREVHTRVASLENAIYIDLVNPDWQIVKIDPSGYRIIESKDCPVRFRRTKGMKPLPLPLVGDRISALREFINVSDEEWPLVVAYLVAALRPGLPCPVLAIHGPQGSAKTTTAEVIRELIDPNTVALRSEPRDVRDLMIAATNSWVIALDNLSSIPRWLSDALCRLSTGGGFGTRQLFTDEDEILFDALRPVMFTGIVELANRSDLLDRAIVLNQPIIEEASRRPESLFWPAFEQARPAILGALYTAISSGLRQLPAIDSHGLSRMADFCVWGMAVESGLELDPGQFMRSYKENRESANDFALEASPVASAIVDLMETADNWEGSATMLLTELEGKVSEEVRKQKEWPKRAHFLTGKLKLIAPNLRAAGINVTIGRTKKGSHITLDGDAGDAETQPDSESEG
ncbi:MAG: bifunctional DNA primase/polymerase [Pyrinomonadaceae bacterium]|nr:bifunctional DNA primase/polymerase [Pyrinomonadaceae bacterium]